MNKKVVKLYYRLILMTMYQFLCQKNAEAEANLNDNGWVELDIPLFERVIWARFGLQQAAARNEKGQG